MISNLAFGTGPTNSDRAALTRALKETVRAHFALGENTSIFVAEVTCGEAACPDVETVIAVFVAGKRREFRIKKAIAAVTEQDLPPHRREAG
jgi:hypothetical protein